MLVLLGALKRRPALLSATNSGDQRHVTCHVAGQGAVEPGIISDLDLPSIGTEAGALVERQRARMIEAAGMDPEPRQRPRPGALQRAVHQQPSCAGADQLCGDTE